MANKNYWYRNFYSRNTPYKPSKDDPVIEEIVQNFALAYLNRPQIYLKFSRAQDRENRLTNFIEKTFKLGGRALEIGAGFGRHFRLARRFSCYYALEPLVSMTRLIAKKPRNVSVLNGRFPEDIERVGPIDSLFAFWADVPVHIFADTVQTHHIDQAFWVMNDSKSEFSQFWPEGARRAWERRSKWLMESGYSLQRVSTEIRFESIHDTKSVLSYLFNLDVEQIRKRSFSQEIRIHYLSTTELV